MFCLLTLTSRGRLKCSAHLFRAGHVCGSGAGLLEPDDTRAPAARAAPAREEAHHRRYGNPTAHAWMIVIGGGDTEFDCSVDGGWHFKNVNYSYLKDGNDRNIT